MSVLARVETRNESSQERRGAPRVKLRLGTAVGPTGASAVVHDISTTGLLFETWAALPGDEVEVQLPNVDKAQARIVWRHGRFVGCEFTDPIPVASVSAALLRSEHPILPNGGRPPVPAAAVGRRTGTPPGKRVGGWLKGLVALAIIAAGAIYLGATDSTAVLLTIGALVAALVTLLMLVASWSLDNAVQL